MSARAPIASRDCASQRVDDAENADKLATVGDEDDGLAHAPASRCA